LIRINKQLNTRELQILGKANDIGQKLEMVLEKFFKNWIFDQNAHQNARMKFQKSLKR